MTELATVPTAQMVSTGSDAITSVDDAIASVAKLAVQQSVEPEKADDTPRAPDGKFAKKDDAPIVAEEVKADETPAVVPEAKPVDEVKPEVKADESTAVAVPKIEGRELHTNFRVLGTDGSEFDIPDVMVEFKANGKTRTESIDKVVKMAEWGVYNHEREQQATQTLANARLVEAQNVHLQARVRDAEAQREKMLKDPDEYMRELAEYEAKNTPEAKLAALQEQERERASETEFRQLSETGSQFFGSEIEPAVETIINALPTVQPEEIGAKLLLITDRFKVNTRHGAIVPPSAYDAVRKAVVDELVPWAQQVHDSRDSERKESTKKLEDTTRIAQVEAQRAKNLAGRVLKPTGRAGKDIPREKPIRTVDDAHESALRATLAGVGMSG